MGAAIFVGNLRFGNVIHLQFDSSGYNFVHAKHVTKDSCCGGSFKKKNKRI